jgi:hypothetical protein
VLSLTTTVTIARHIQIVSRWLTVAGIITALVLMVISRTVMAVALRR